MSYLKSTALDHHDSLRDWLQTRIFVTHRLNYLRECDLIVVMVDGKITERGSYDQLLHGGGAFADFLETYLQEVAADPEETQSGWPFLPHSCSFLLETPTCCELIHWLNLLACCN